MRTRLLSFGVWALVAAAAMFWGLKLSVGGTSLPAQAQTPARGPALGGEWRRLLGDSASAAADDEEDGPAGSDRFRLLGVVAPRGAGASSQGVAVIAVGDQPARAWRTGAVIDGDTVLLSVDRRSASLGPRGGPATTELTLPEPARSTGPAVAPIGRPPLINGLPPTPTMPGAIGQRPMGIPGQGGLVAPKPGGQAANNSNDDDDE